MNSDTDHIPTGTVTLQKVTKKYDEAPVVNQISTEVAAGEFFSLLGPSGSGKTTTLMMIAGFVQPDSGSILVDGKNIVEVPPEKRGFGMVFQNYAIFPHMNVFDNVAFPLRVRKTTPSEVARRVEEVLELVRLSEYAKRFSRQLSGGQQQRVAIARAIVFRPALILMDEPLGALDKNLRYQMQVEIKEIQRQLRTTVIYVTHDQEEAMNMSDRIAIMNNGIIEQVGPADHVYERPVSSFTAKFLGEANLVAGTLLERSGEGVGTVRAVGGQLLRGLCESDMATESPANVFVRPERVTIRPPSSTAIDDQNSLTGYVERISFLGSVLRYQVKVSDTLCMTVDMQNSASKTMGVGDHVTLTWGTADTKILVNAE